MFVTAPAAFSEISRKIVSFFIDAVSKSFFKCLRLYDIKI
jgi:hypothetical protein